MAKRALITGVTGQDGTYLAELLIEKKYIVYGLARHTSTVNVRIEKLREIGVVIKYGDMTDLASLIRVVKDTRPDEIYNLAAQSFVGTSFDQGGVTLNVDGVGVLHLLEAVKIIGIRPKILQASTSELYGMVQEIPQKETTPFYPRSPYGCAKLYGYWICKNYRESYNFFVCNSICFNHESPRRGEQFVTRKITKSIGNILKGKQKYINIGNIDSCRDWGHAKDYVRAMHLMLQQDEPDDYIIATGKTTSVREFIRKAFYAVGVKVEFSGERENEVAHVVFAPEDSILKKGDIVMRVDPELYRPAEVDLLIGDASKSKEILGWEPTTSLDELVVDMISKDVYGAYDPFA